MRSLYQCGRARVLGEDIKCSAGHKLSARKNGGVAVIRAVRGDTLELGICQHCADYDHMGDSVLKEDRGWLKRES